MSALLGMVAFGVDQAFLNACDRTVATVMGLCYFIAPTFLTIALIVMIGRGYLQGNGLAMDWSVLVKPILLFLLLYFYPDMMNVLGTGLGAFPAALKQFAGGSSAARIIQQLTQPVATLTTPGGDPPSMFDFVQQGGQIISDLKDMLSNFSIMGLLTRLFTTTTVLLIRNLFFFIRQFVLGFLYVSGPIVIALSMIPAFSGLAKSWLQNYISVQMWALTFALLDIMYSNYADTQMTGGGLLGNLNVVGQDKFTIMSISFVLLYCMVPWLTGLVIGSTAAQGFVGQMAGMAVGAATSAAGFASPGVGGLAGAAGRMAGNGGSAATNAVANVANQATQAAPAVAAAVESSAASSLPTVTMAEAMTPTYRQTPSGIWL